MAVMLRLTVAAEFLGIPGWAILPSWFFKYCYLVLEKTALGIKEPPPLEMMMLNPFDELRPLKQLMILSGAGILLSLCYTLGELAGVVMTALAIMLFPASIAVLAVTHSAIQAINPVLLVRITLVLGTAYIGLWLLIGASLAALYFVVESGIGLLLTLAFILYLFILLFHVIGTTLYEKRGDLGLEVFHSPDKTRAEDQRLELKTHQRFLDLAYGDKGLDARSATFRELIGYIDGSADPLATHAWFHQELGQLDHKRLYRLHAERYLERLMSADQPLQALSVARDALQRIPGFRPESPRSTLRLAQLARERGETAVALQLLEGLMHASPPTEYTADALLLAAGIVVDKGDDNALAMRHIDQALSLAPNHSLRGQFEAIRRDLLG